MQGKTTLTDYIRLIKSLPFFDRSIINKYIFWKIIPKAMLVKTSKSFSLIKYVSNIMIYDSFKESQLYLYHVHVVHFP